MPEPEDPGRKILAGILAIFGLAAIWVAVVPNVVRLLVG